MRRILFVLALACSATGGLAVGQERDKAVPLDTATSKKTLGKRTTLEGAIPPSALPLGLPGLRSLLESSAQARTAAGIGSLLRTPEIARSEKEYFAWYQREKEDLLWLTELPTPPDHLSVNKSKAAPFAGAQSLLPLVTERPFVLPEGWEWDSPVAMQVLGYHPKASYGIRSKTPTASGAGQQAMYDRKGQLITGGLSAGTPDRVSPRHSLSKHHEVDVKPFDLAKWLDQKRGGDAFRRLYLEVRPPCHYKTATRNILD